VLLEDGKLVPKHVGDTSLIYIYIYIFIYLFIYLFNTIHFVGTVTDSFHLKRHGMNSFRMLQLCLLLGAISASQFCLLMY
jgi:hypothetical protein